MTEPSSTPSSLDEELRQARASADEYLAGWKRAQADYANLKKDSEREKMEFAKYANERLLQELLPAIDQFEMALRFEPELTGLPDEQRQRFQGWIQGLQAVKSLWFSAFQTIGLEKVAVSDVFNPQFHEAVAEEASDDTPPGGIVRVVQDGWRLHDKLLRPAKVVVSGERVNNSIT